MRTTHNELSGRAFNLDPNYLDQTNHATHVAGIIGARGTNGAAIGIAPNVRVLALDLQSDRAGIPFQVATNDLLQSNHSYGNKTVGWNDSYSYFTTDCGGISGRFPIWCGATNINRTEDTGFGNYSDDATNIDGIICQHPTTVICWAAGNERDGDGQPAVSPSSGFFITDNQGGNPFIHPCLGNWFTPPGNDFSTHNGYFTLLPNGAAKNSIVVAATSANTNGYTGPTSVTNASYSSRGPARDGRIKPDVAGVGGDDGVQVFSCFATANNAYGNLSGTSMATPNVSGAVALLRQRWNQFNPTNQPAWASTVKAILIHTASQLGTNRGPNFRTGWGLVNVSNAVELVRTNFQGFTLSNLPLSHVKEMMLQNGTTNEFPISVPSGTSLLKVTLAWTDPVGPLNSRTNMTLTNSVWLAKQRALVNDLDLRVIGNGQTNLPCVLDPPHYDQAATRGDDLLNNVEMVEVDNPPAGVYTVRISHKGTLRDGGTNLGPQAFSLAITGNSDGSVPPLALSDVLLVQTNTALAFK